MAASASSSLHGHGDTTLSPSATSSIAPSSSTLYASSSTSHTFPSSSSIPSTSLSGTDHLRDVFNKRIRSLVFLKRSLQGQRIWFQAVQLNPTDLASTFDNERMHKRTLRYFMLGLSLSSILEIPNPSDMARAIVSLINELDSYTDDNIVTLTSGTGATSYAPSSRPKMRSFFSKSGKHQTLKRSTAAQAISEFGMLDSNVMGGPSSSSLTASATGLGGSGNEQSSYMMAPNLPFQLDFFQTFFTLCDMLTEIYYKMLSFLPRDQAGCTEGMFGRAGSPPTSASGNMSLEYDHSASISKAFADGYGEAGDRSAASIHATTNNVPAISGMTQELLLKADAKIKKTIQAQVKDIDVLARQSIKDELASLDPLMKDLGLDTAAGGSGASSTFVGSTAGAKAGASIGGLPSTSNTSLPFGFSAQSTSNSNTTTAAMPTSSNRSADKGIASSFIRRQPKPSPAVAADSSRSTQQDLPSQQQRSGHHQFNLGSLSGENQSSNVTGDYRADADSNVPTTGAGGGVALGSLIRSRSGKLRRVLSNDAAGGMPLPTQSSAGVTSPTSSSSAGHAESLTHAVSSPSKDA